MSEIVTGLSVLAVLLRGGFLLLLAVSGWQDYKHRRIKVHVFWGFGITGGLLRGLGMILERRFKSSQLLDMSRAMETGPPDVGAWGELGGGLAERGPLKLTEGGFGGIMDPGAGPFMGSSWADIGAAVAIGFLLLALSAVTEEAVGKGDGWFFVVSGMYLGFWRNLELLFGSLFLCLIAGGVLLVRNLIGGGRGNTGLRKQSLPFLTLAVPAGLGVLIL